jgi:hypothetical protein
MADTRKSGDEPDSGAEWPLETRASLSMAPMRKCRVRGLEAVGTEERDSRGIKNGARKVGLKGSAECTKGASHRGAHHSETANNQNIKALRSPRGRWPIFRE